MSLINIPNTDDLLLSECKIETFRSSGKGGQHANKTESAVRLTHEPTGVVVECQDGRSQHANYDKAMKVLRSKLYEIEVKKQNDEIAGKRKTMVGSGDRSDKIRPYNYPQGRVTDHRINLTLHKLEEFMQGEIFEEMIESLTLQAQEEELSKLN